MSQEACLSVWLSFTQGSQHSGSSLSLASTKVCSSMDEGDGPSSECTTEFFFFKKQLKSSKHQPVHWNGLFMSPSAVELMLLDEYPAVPSSIAERYKVGRTLGDGNFAVVRECMERSTGREYALKIINKDKCRGKVRHLDC